MAREFPDAPPDVPELVPIVEAWKACSEFHSWRRGASEDQIEEAEARIGRRLPASFKGLYRISDGMHLLEGNLMIDRLGVHHPMAATDGVVGMSDHLREHEWPIPEELLIFGSDGSESLLGLWLPAARRKEDAPVILTGEPDDPLPMAVVGTSLSSFLAGWTACYAQIIETEPKVLDALRLPNSLRSDDPDEELLYACLRWADSNLPDKRPDPYSNPITADRLRELFQP